jgi:nicotinamide-nucleotide amidase
MSDVAALPPALAALGVEVGGLLRERAATVAVCESAVGGLAAAALVAVPGCSAFFVGGAVVYTLAASRALLGGVIETPKGMRGATEEFARYQATAIRLRLDATWGIGETGATGPDGNPYGDPPGHGWVAAVGSDGTPRTRRISTGSADRSANMVAFAVASLTNLRDALLA